MTKRVSSLSSPKVRFALALIGFAALGGCTHQSREAAIVTGGLPDDYRLRHPIVVQEASKTTEIFVGHARGGLTAAQRADVAGLSQEWLREGTGAIIIDIPTGTPNAQAAKQTLAEIQGILTSAGIPPRGINVRPYQPTDPRQFATIRMRYPRIMADAGPCGTWPEDLGPSIKDKSYYENREYHNFGCASQRNLAAMIDNPADLVQPRAETPSNSARRTEAFVKYRNGQPTAVTYTDSDKAKLSDLGK
jgi:pilus assembly protein CpaD